MEKDESLDIDWSVLQPAKPDGHQIYVFGIHFIVGIAISILSFDGDWVQWFAGTGLLTPLSVIAIGFLYGMFTGIDWYRNEFLPLVNRHQMNLELENEAFLRYQRLHQIVSVISGYLTVVVCQLLWTQVALTIIAVAETVSRAGEFLSYIAIGFLILWLTVYYVFISAFESILKRRYSDAHRLIEIEADWVEYVKKKDEEVKDRAEGEVS